MQRQARFLTRRHHMIGVGHLQFVAIAFDTPADDACLADGQGFQEVIGPAMKEHQLQNGRIVRTAHPVRPPPVGRRHMVQHMHLHGGDPPRLRLAQAGAIAPVHHAHRQVQDQVDQPWSRHARNQLLHLGADARQGVRFREQGKKNRWAHGRHLMGCGAWPQRKGPAGSPGRAALYPPP